MRGIVRTGLALALLDQHRVRDPHAGLINLEVFVDIFTSHEERGRVIWVERCSQGYDLVQCILLKLILSDALLFLPEPDNGALGCYGDQVLGRFVRTSREIHASEGFCRAICRSKHLFALAGANLVDEADRLSGSFANCEELRVVTDGEGCDAFTSFLSLDVALTHVVHVLDDDVVA